ncbi:MAG: hypothetical protein MRK02_02830 [Candidatus Scalindua sp.]|nr:hypothetical protein [Candidatus Scalindua sp.]
MTSCTSEKSELKFVGLVRVSTEEQLLDYQDFLKEDGFTERFYRTRLQISNRGKKH